MLNTGTIAGCWADWLRREAEGGFRLSCVIRHAVRHLPMKEVVQNVMNRYLACALLVMTALTAQAQVPSDDLAAAQAEILPLFEAMQAAANVHDAEKHVSFYGQ